MIFIKNYSNEYLLVRNAAGTMEEIVAPRGGEVNFGTSLWPVTIALHNRKRTDGRFDPRGGDPYNRVGHRAAL